MVNMGYDEDEGFRSVFSSDLLSLEALLARNRVPKFLNKLLKSQPHGQTIFVHI